MPRKKLLLVAYHFPPIQGSTGITRTVAFSRYLREHGWDVCVLTIQAGAYESTAAENELLIPKNVAVERAWGVDVRRSLAIAGRYPRILALPDRWQSWILGGTIRGGRLIRRWRPDILMTTYPIPSAHAIGLSLKKRFGIPWIAEFRDPMLQSDYPTDKWERRSFAWLEERIFKHADEIVVTTDACRDMYLDRYPAWIDSRITTISNGYDPEIFNSVDLRPQPRRSESLVLLHSGLLYASERDPTAFFSAVRMLKNEGFFDSLAVEFRFRASGNEADYVQQVKRLEIDPYVRFLPRISYAEAVQEMTNADALMIFQASNCNSQIPAKIYEYMYCRKPILGLTDPGGETARLLQQVGVNTIANLEDAGQIASLLKRFLIFVKSDEAFKVSESDALQFSRRTLTGKLDDVLTRAMTISKENVIVGGS